MLDIDDEEDEHSIEMQLPFIFKAIGNTVKIVPILTGPVNEEMARADRRARGTSSDHRGRRRPPPHDGRGGRAPSGAG